jgi:hypothetical protein
VSVKGKFNTLAQVSRHCVFSDGLHLLAGSRTATPQATPPNKQNFSTNFLCQNKLCYNQLKNYSNIQKLLQLNHMVA